MKKILICNFPKYNLEKGNKRKKHIKIKVMDISEFNSLIRNRRSIFPNMYTGERVDDQVIQQMLENARWAPTHKHTNPWRFCVFTLDGLQKLADFQSQLYKSISTQAGNFLESKFEMLRTKPLLASHIISIGMRRDPAERLPEIEEVEAVACAVQNMYLTASAYGVGCYWGSGGITYVESAKDFFGLEAKDKLLGFLYIGVPKKIPEGRRESMDDKVKWIR
jgi:nitroreductase